MSTFKRVIGLIGCALLSSTAANAEYYIVGPVKNDSCYAGCCTCAATQQTTKRIYNDKFYYRHKVNHYKIEQITTTCVAPAYDRPKQNKHAFVNFNYTGGKQRGRYVNMDNDPYNPDMATADDEIMVDSDMNNQY